MKTQLFQEYQAKVLKNQPDFIKDYQSVLKRVAASPAKYKGKPVEFLYQPMFLTKEDMGRFEEIINQLMVILNKVVHQYLKDEKFRQYFGFSPLLEKLILKDPGYGIDIPMGRFDVFYHQNGDFQFCELNADGSSGMTEARELENIILQSKALEPFKEQYQLEGFELFYSWVDALLTNYEDFSGGLEKPNVAIVDWLQGSPPSEFEEFKKAFEARGCATVIVDPRNLSYRNGQLYHEGFRIDCIYRRAVTWELIERQDEVQDLIQAYLEGNVCVVGPLRSQIIHNKIVFAILHDPVKTPFLTHKERAFVQAHIPFTTLFEQEDQEVVAYAIEHKDRMVLKPMDKYASQGVRIGKDFTLEQWQQIINEEAREDYLLQEFCCIPRLPMAMIKEEEVHFIENNYLLGLFVYNEKLQGVYTRTGTQNIIGSVVECYTVPNFVVQGK
ncbi:conserved hypothetical protein [Alkaliphilus metalliredigens QYMF]|uniref:Circularly permuted ATP-grasp type 2 domain-containing protein n=1 Tax=Alkaliphilus metalliredigens (strain QYMF) TaxID=293826 RepID=A6TWY8_ALKMQ|nr:circularly permuted type 2 ATP-grasp protein [Alkaliphilus metalliredigens]ABR50706.1 conserved hypothetical protein [Alkaliphilus metalliredigens QYMF]